MLASGVDAQTNLDIVRGNEPITWLGLDFTQARFIGKSSQYKDVGEISLSTVRDRYIPAWNGLFIDEQEKYDIAKQVRRKSVTYAMDITTQANKQVGGDFFSDNPSDYARLTRADITNVVRNYDFKGAKGIGLIIFIEGMSKGKEEAAGWITFVNMERKEVLSASLERGEPGGFGFRNYWAKAFLEILKKADNR